MFYCDGPPKWSSKTKLWEPLLFALLTTCQTCKYLNITVFQDTTLCRLVQGLDHQGGAQEWAPSQQDDQGGWPDLDQWRQLSLPAGTEKTSPWGHTTVTLQPFSWPTEMGSPSPSLSSVSSPSSVSFVCH